MDNAVKLGLKQRRLSKIASFSFFKGHSNKCFLSKLPISLNEFYDQCLTSGISFKSVCECDFITFYHCVRLELRLCFLRKTKYNMLNVTIVESSKTYGKLKGPV